MSEPIVHILPDAHALVEHTAQWLAKRMAASTGRFTMALSGGSTPGPLYRRLADPDLATSIPWDRVHLFWGDERFVPHDDPASNYRLVREALIDHVPIPPANVHPVPNDATPEAAAQSYARTLQEYYGDTTLRPGSPLFDVNLLGIGDDGHTASLFPGAPQLEEMQRWAVAVVGQKPEPRISLTYPVLASARTVAFLVSGAGKRAAVTRALRHDAALPSGRVRSDGELLWLLDRAAAPESVQ